MAKPFVRDCMGRTVRADDSVSVLGTGRPLVHEPESSNDPDVQPQLGQEYDVEEVREEDGYAIISVGGATSRGEFNMRFALAPDDMELAGASPDACDLVIEENKLLEKAKEGNADAQYTLGRLYAPLIWRHETGDRMREPREMAVKWFELAAKQGHAEAQYCFSGYFDYDDPSTAPDAVKWLLAAASQGIAEACMSLSEYYIEYGSDEAEGLRWYRRARESGHPHAAHVLGILEPVFNLGGPPPKEFLRDITKAAYASDSESQYMLGVLLATGTYGVEQSMSNAHAWFALAAGCTPGCAVTPAPVGQSSHEGWGTADRAFRLLAQVLSDKELHESREKYRESQDAISQLQIETRNRSIFERARNWLLGR